MAKGICLDEICTNPAKRRGYCGPCHYRLKKQGALPPAKLPIRERFMDVVEKVPSGCWEWQACKNDLGYGQLALLGGKRVGAHRFSYEKFVGPIPEGMDLDHLCRNPPCVNPAHLEPVTHRENVYRGASLDVAAHLEDKCRRGHDMTPENTYQFPNGRGRTCRKCMRIRNLRRNRSRKTATAS